jgi:hypothetical protein
LRDVVRKLHSAAVDFADTPPVRRPSLCTDATPVVLSHESWRARDEASDVRVLVEPGGLHRTIPEQIDFALRTVDAVVHKVGWHAVIPELNAIIARTFPRRASDVVNWWGGIWLAVAGTPNDFTLRLYANLRDGSADARWRRVATILSSFGEPTSAPIVEELVRRTGSIAIPVGLGIAIAGSRVRALRLYCGVHSPSFATMAAAWPDSIAPRLQDWSRACVDIEAAVGSFSPQSVTIGHDLCIDDGAIVPAIARVKFDVCCQFVASHARPALVALLDRLARRFGVDADSMHLFVADVDACFGGCRVEFLSVGFANASTSVAVYVKPAGYATL